MCGGFFVFKNHMREIPVIVTSPANVVSRDCLYRNPVIAIEASPVVKIIESLDVAAQADSAPQGNFWWQRFRAQLEFVRVKSAHNRHTIPSACRALCSATVSQRIFSGLSLPPQHKGISWESCQPGHAPRTKPVAGQG